MEIIQNRYGSDRVIEKISPSKLRIMGESLMSRSSQDENENYTMYDFEGGPILTVGGKIRYMKSNWTILKITPENLNKENICSVIVEVKI
jgi:hypothetical protein